MAANLAAFAVIAALAALAGCGDGDGDDDATPSPPPERSEPGYGGGGAPGAPQREQGEDEPETDADGEASVAPDPEQAVVRAVRRYLRGLDARDGERVCGLLLPGAIEEVELPRRRGGCARSLEASIGYRDPRGLPVFDGLRVAEIAGVVVEGETARARATTVTTFADRDEPSIEDDVVHLVEVAGRWRIAKPSAALYRAVGIADVPPSVLAPPEA